MSIFSQPIPFEEAIASHEARTLLGTTLDSAEMRAVLDELPDKIKRRVFFSSQAANYDILEGFYNGVGNALNRPLGAQDFRTSMRNQLKDLGYSPEPGEEGTIKDLSSFARLKVMLDTNQDLALGFGQMIQGNSEESLDAFPAWELIRIEDRRVERGSTKAKGVAEIGWDQRFEEACEQTGDDRAAAAFEATGRRMATKDSPVWAYLGEAWEDSLGNDYPPYAWGTGTWRVPVNREDAIDAGLIDPEQKIKPRKIPDFNENVQASVETRDGELLAALKAALPDWVELGDDGVLRMKSSS